MQESGETERGERHRVWRVLLKSRQREREREEEGGGRITAGHAGEKESEQIRRNEGRRESLEGGEAGTVVWKTASRMKEGRPLAH